MEKNFVGRCKPGKYPDQVEIGFTKDDIQKLFDALNEKGYTNVRINKGKESGKPYAEIISVTSTI